MPPDLVDEVLNRFPDQQVSRVDLRSLAAEAADVTNRELFVASMIWGRGKSNGRMLPGFMRVLRSPSCDDVLALTAEHVIDGDFEGAHRMLDMRGVREPFFTKWF